VVEVTDASEEPRRIHRCALRRCNEPAVNPHSHSLCERHHPGDATLDEPHERPPSTTDDIVDEEERLAEASAVAGAEYEPEQSENPHTDAAIEDAIARKRDEDDGGDEQPDEDVEDFSMHLFMGGGVPSAESDESDERKDLPSSGSTGMAAPVSGLPLAQLDAMSPADRRRAAKKRGVDWPSTDDARDQLFDTIAATMRNEDARVVDAPTSLGKSFTVATTRWGARDDITGDRPVIHLSETRDARDEAIEVADEHGGQYFVLKSRHEACPVAAGDYDPPDDDDVDIDYMPITVDGVPASDVIQELCDGRGLPFSAVHRYLEDNNDQSAELPCCEGSSTSYDHEDGEFNDGESSECPAIHQWERYRDGDWPLVLATHNFAHVPGIRSHNNVVLDESVDFAADLETARVRDAVGAYLREIDAPVTTWEHLLTLAEYDGWGDDAAAEREAMEQALDCEPDREWYFTDERAHTMAPALARAIFHAEERSNGRRVGKTPYEPPRLDANVHDEDSWNQEWLTVVLDEHNDVRTVRSVPDFSAARSVVGLDAHPALPVWQANTLPYIQRAEVLEPEARRLWRRYERGLRVVQVGDATRPLASGEYFDSKGVRVLIKHLREQYGDDLRTALTADSVEDRLARIMKNSGCGDVETMHFGEEKSRNDFEAERVGLVNGCIDPGDDYVVDLLAELDLDAEPERSETVCDDCEGDGCHECDGTGFKRAHGRGFVGDDACTAQEILASVRENHTAQAAGRYARDPTDPESTATVFVRTDAMPAGFTDVQTSGVVWRFSRKQEEIIEALRDASGRLSARNIANRTDASKRHVHRTLERLLKEDVVDAVERHGPNGATMYAKTGVPNAGVADLTDEDGEVVTAPVWSSYTWTVAIADPSDADPSRTAGSSSSSDETTGVWDWEAGAGGG
jgi:DNA-binding transcriptional ArsR family regulator